MYVYAYLNIFSKHDPELWRPSVMLWQWVGCQPHREVLMCVAGASGGIPVPDVPRAIIQWTNLNHNKFGATRTVSIGSRFNPKLLKLFFLKLCFFLNLLFWEGYVRDRGWLTGYDCHFSCRDWFQICKRKTRVMLLPRWCMQQGEVRWTMM